ncbi:MAG: putative formate dehydrogenase formation protein [Gemmatimonadetes bacterium]|nr:putative formate dehydrogenase formation protein [Gemmatimonadota bacterium]
MLNVPPSRSGTVRSTLAEQFAPVLRVHAYLRAEPAGGLDLDRARERVARGYSAYDPQRVLAAAGDLHGRFARLLAAFEVAGLVSSEDSRALLHDDLDVNELVIAWIRADHTSRDARRRIARQVAVLVGNSVLGAAADVVSGGEVFRGWTRPTCPCCDGTPDIALADGGADRTLICARCDTRWHSAWRTCLGCQSDELARIHTPSLDYDLVICNACGRFITERAHAGLQPLIVERAITAELAVAAEQRGLRF